MIEILNRFTGEIIYRSESAKTITEAIVEMIAIAKEKNEGANLEGANLEGANLVRANLYGANLEGANLVRANLVRANLYGANLEGANLVRANLEGANLYGANLVRANLYDANLVRANLVRLGVDSRGYHFFLRRENSELFITAGCRRFSIPDAKKHWTERHEMPLRAEILARVRMAEQIAMAYGWITEGD